MRTYRREGRVIWLGNTDSRHEFGHEFDTIREARKAEKDLAEHSLYREVAS